VTEFARCRAWRPASEAVASGKPDEGARVGVAAPWSVSFNIAGNLLIGWPVSLFPGVCRHIVMGMRKKWVVPVHDRVAVHRLARSLGVSDLIARLLMNRGFADPPSAARFLEPTLHELRDPCELDRVKGAAAFLVDAIRSGRAVTIFGDYDADGICATALMLKCLKLIGGKVDFYVPRRYEEGYGLSCQALQELAGRGTEVVVTVDCGVTAVQEAELARRLGIDLIVTDHHEPGPRMPHVPFLLNPKVEGCDLGFRDLCGAGVAFKLLWAVGQSISHRDRVSEAYKDFLLEALSLVAIGTIADVVPILDENRVLVKFGLKTLPHCTTPGLKALQAVATGGRKELSAYDVAFKLAPLINAAGRMGDAQVAVELLTTDDQRLAAELAEHLGKENRRRRAVQKATLEEARRMVGEEVDLERSKCIVLSRADWHLGVVGLVASRLAETFWRPAFVFTVEEGIARGSGRSIPGFHLFKALQQCQDLLERYGGHEGAAGVTLREEKLAEFARRMDEVSARFSGGEPPVAHLYLDAELALDNLGPAVINEMNGLSPFGEGNPRPLLAASGLTLAGNPQLVGTSGDHLSFLVRQGRSTLRAIAFGKAGWFQELVARRSEPFSLAFEPRIDTYNPYGSVELRVEDMQWQSERDVRQECWGDHI